MERDLLQGTENARIQFEGALETAHSLFEFSLATRDEAGQHEDTGIIR